MRTLTKFAALALLLVAITAGCKRTVDDNREAIQTAETAIENAQYDQALDICESLVKENAGDSLLSANDYCRIALAMKKISDATDNGDITASAVNCYRSAEALSGDSIMSFLSSLQPADASIFLKIMLIASSQGATFGDSVEGIDTIPADSI